MTAAANSPKTADGGMVAQKEAPGKTAAVSKPHVKHEFRRVPVMNIPTGFFLLMVPLMLVILIYVVGIIINDMSREDQDAVEETFGTLN